MMLLDRRLLPVFVELMLDSGARCTFGGLVSAEKEIARWRDACGGINLLLTRPEEVKMPGRRDLS